MVSIDGLIFVESAVAGALILACIVIAVINRDILASEKARLKLKENLFKLRAAVVISLSSLYFYFFGEMVVVGTGFNFLPSDYRGLHDVAEAIHLFLLIIGFSLGLQLLMTMKGDG